MIQIKPEGIGPTMKHIINAIEPFMGKPKVSQKHRNNTLLFSEVSEIPPQISMKIKIEINCREHFSVFGFQNQLFSMQSRWFTGSCLLTTFTLEDLLGSKLRALYQRKKGRDLFDLWYGLVQGKADPDKIIKAFYKYMDYVSCKVTQKNYLRNLDKKKS